MTSTLLCRTAVLCLLFLLLPLPLWAEMEYLRQEQIDLRLDQSDNVSTLPLDPSHEYRVDIQSAYTFRPMLDIAHKCYTHNKEEVGFFFTRVVPIQECRTVMPFLINDVLVPTRAYASTTNAAYFLDLDTGQHYVPQLVLRLWGTGRPLSLKSTTDFSDDIPSATASVIDLVYEQAQKNEAKARQRAEEKRRIEQERQEMIRVGIKIGSGVLLVALVGCLCYALVMRYSPERDKRRVARLTREIQDELRRMDTIRRSL